MDGTGEPRRPTKLAVALVGLFVLAVVMGRLLIAGGALWVAFAVLATVVLVATGAKVGWRFAVAITVGFTALVLGVRWAAQTPMGWIALLLFPVVALTALLVGRVLGVMRASRRTPPGTEGPETLESRPLE